MSEPTYPFLSFGLTGIALILSISSNLIYSKTRMFTAFLAIQSLVMVLLWIYLLAFLLKDGHKSSSALVVFALLSNFILNIFWYFYYKKKVVKLDHSYQLYMDHYPKT